MGPPQEAPDHAGGRMASGGRLCIEEGVSVALLRLLRLVPTASAFAVSFAASLAPPIGASPKVTCRCAINPIHTPYFMTYVHAPSAQTLTQDCTELHGNEWIKEGRT